MLWSWWRTCLGLVLSYKSSTPLLCLVWTSAPPCLWSLRPCSDHQAAWPAPFAGTDRPPGRDGWEGQWHLDLCLCPVVSFHCFLSFHSSLQGLANFLYRLVSIYHTIKPLVLASNPKHFFFFSCVCLFIYLFLEVYFIFGTYLLGDK